MVWFNEKAIAQNKRRNGKQISEIAHEMGASKDQVRSWLDD